MEITRETLELALENADLMEDGNIRIRTYSGRGMYGSTCAAVTLPSASLMAFVVELTLLLAEDGQEGEARRLAAVMRTDSMGLDIVAYWPGVDLAG